jgi:hypothetical protein
VAAHIPTLLQCSHKGLLGHTAGGPKALARLQTIERKLVAEGSISESELSALTKDDYVKMLDSKKRLLTIAI